MDKLLLNTVLASTSLLTLSFFTPSVQATFWDMSEKLSVRQQIRQKDSVLGVERWAEHLVVSSTFVTLNSLEDTNQRRIVADDARQDESLMVGILPPYTHTHTHTYTHTHTHTHTICLCKYQYIV